jgi:hypothetical protein
MEVIERVTKLVQDQTLRRWFDRLDPLEQCG